MRRWMAVALAATLGLPALGDSLWKGAASPHAHWFADTKARRVGDVVTILINEESKAKTDLTQTHTKETKTNAVISEFRELFGVNKPADGASDEEKGLPVMDWESSREFDSKAENESTESLELRISAVVKEVLPNGNLLIDASRRIRHDDDIRMVHLTGIVRPIDVSAANTVASTSIAVARISYEGYGPATRIKRKGWGNRFLDVIWPF
ncbi:MAG: flagellar basal body L-ring protein FlgH [Planctomycetota bacterium]